jgi:hypothetical protein
MKLAPASKRVAMNQSMISFVVGIVVLLCVAIFAAAWDRREHKDEPVTGPLDAHPIKEWLRHKH